MGVTGLIACAVSNNKMLKRAAAHAPTAETHIKHSPQRKVRESFVSFQPPAPSITPYNPPSIRRPLMPVSVAMIVAAVPMPIFFPNTRTYFPLLTNCLCGFSLIVRLLRHTSPPWPKLLLRCDRSPHERSEETETTPSLRLP